MKFLNAEKQVISSYSNNSRGESPLAKPQFFMYYIP